MASDLYVKHNGERVKIGEVTKVNDDGTVEVEMTPDEFSNLVTVRLDLFDVFGGAKCWGCECGYSMPEPLEYCVKCGAKRQK